MAICQILMFIFVVAGITIWANPDVDSYVRLINNNFLSSDENPAPTPKTKKLIGRLSSSWDLSTIDKNVMDDPTISSTYESVNDDESRDESVDPPSLVSEDDDTDILPRFRTTYREASDDDDVDWRYSTESRSSFSFEEVTVDFNTLDYNTQEPVRPTEYRV